MAFLVAIEGIDGAGKGTLAQGLVRRAAGAGVDAAMLAFPRYDETRFARLVAQYLNGRFGPLDEVPVRFAALLFAGDRFESRDHLLALAARHRLLILDRYVASNAAYQAAKLPETERAAVIDWIHELEYGVFELPRPDLTCLLATRPAIADRLVARKPGRRYTERARDLHESDAGYMGAVASVYDGLCAAGAEGPWLRCQALDADGALRSPQAIADDAWTHIAAALAAKAG